MAIVGSLFALAGRFAGRVVNALLGWATILLFGRVEARKQTILGFVVMGSLVWVGAIVGLLVPDVGTYIVAAVPRPDFVDEGLIRPAMLAAVLTIPLVIGAAGVWMTQSSSRPDRAGLVAGVLRGYPFTALLALMMAFLAVVAFVRKVNSLRRRWQDAHIPVVVKPGRYEELVEDLLVVLRRAGVSVDAGVAPRVLSVPPRLLDRVAGRALGGMVPDHLAQLVAPGIDILVYPSAVAISGEKSLVARARTAIASKLADAPAWLTMTAEAQDIEDRLEAISHLESVQVRERALEDIDRLLGTVIIPFEEWETLYRMRLQLERDALPAPSAAIEAEPDAVTDFIAASMAAGETVTVPRPAHRPLWKRVGSAVGVVSLLGLIAADIAILLGRGDRGAVPARTVTTNGSVKDRLFHRH